MPRILIVEDEPNMVRTLTKILERRGFDVSSAGTGADALEQLMTDATDLVVTDLKMPRMDGMELLSTMRDRGLDHPVIVLTGYGTVQSAVDAMKLGAADYLIKPCNPEELLLIVERELENRRIRRENVRLRRELEADKRFGALVGRSAPMQRVYEMVDAVSRNQSSVLVTGESGTGKELVARTIHERSPLAERPFVAVNCAGMSETLIDSQLFGHKRGAFTGAVNDHEGLFLAATGGTLFLDEVFEVPLSLQAKFLRAIQEREVTPLGSTRSIPVDVRIVTATNHELDEEVRRGRFRADLYYRLNVVTIALPPLRERKDDLGPLVEHFLGVYAENYGVEPKRVTDEAFQAICRYDWPGNVRELQNVIERAFALSQSPEIDLPDLPPPLRGEKERANGAILSFDDVPSLDEMERRVIQAALDRSQGNKNRAARLLGIDRQRLYRKLDKYGLR